VKRPFVEVGEEEKESFPGQKTGVTHLRPRRFTLNLAEKGKKLDQASAVKRKD